MAVKKLKRILLILSALIFAGCSAVSQHEPSIEGVLYRGVYTFGFEVSAFPNNDTSDYWLYSESRALDEIDKSLMNMIVSADGEKPYPCVYIEFYGFNDGPPSIEDGEIASSYDALINVLRVVQTSSIEKSCP